MASNAFFNRSGDYTTADVLNTPVRRGGILPVTEYPNRTELDWSSGLTGALMDAFTAPDRARRGEISEDQMIPEGFNFAGSLTLGNLLSGAAAPARQSAMAIYKGMGPADAPTDALRTARISGADRFVMNDAATTFANQRTALSGDELLDLLYGRGMGPANSNSATAELFANAKTGAAVPLATRALEAQQPQGIRAFHGSPHDFDRFSMDAIGTGEGAQAYGHGLYFAEAEDVAKTYRSPNPPSRMINSLVAKAQQGGLSFDDFMKTVNPAFRNEFQLAWDEALGRGGPGHMYEVNIKADPESFIDYDIPLGQQSEAVRRALDEAGLMPYTVVDQAGNRIDFSRGMPKAEAERFAAAKGGRAIPKDDADFDAVRKAQMMTGRGDAAQADIATALREAGIPGIRYLDQMSRGTGEGSSNYVVFDDALVEILRKYGLLPPVAAGGLAAALGQEDELY